MTDYCKCGHEKGDHRQFNDLYFPKEKGSKNMNLLSLCFGGKPTNILDMHIWALTLHYAIDEIGEQCGCLYFEEDDV